MELFESKENGTYQPLAARMRPRTLDEYIGQEHIIGPGRLLRRAIQADQLSSLIFYGPPGTGKTTLAQVIANTTKSHFTTLNAVLSGVKELRIIIEEAKERRSLYDRKTILFIDEVHRWNKSQQDGLLPWVENGTLILIGATTENPFFEVNKALVSRSRIFQLKSLSNKNLEDIIKLALKSSDRGYGKKNVIINQEAKEHLLNVANGDARSLLNALELAIETTPPDADGSLYVTLDIAEESIQTKAVLYDKEGDYHFDVISAFIKSMRGSDPDATLYWLGKMVYAGESPRFIFRRMLIFASEDVGLADPNALVIVEAAASAFERMGMPEGRFPLTHAALYLATAQKSNSTMAFFDVLEAVGKEKDREVPIHLRDGSRDGEAFGHQENYLYPHSYRDHWVAQQYLPTALQGKVFYHPSNMGYEAKIKETVDRRREIQLAVITEKEEVEILTFSPGNKNQEQWLKRLNKGTSPMLEDIRIKLYEGINIPRHYRILDLKTGSGLLLWEAFRRVPEGGVWGLCPEEKNRQIISHYSAQLNDSEQPILIPTDLTQLLLEKKRYIETDLSFEILQGRNIFTRIDNKNELMGQLSYLLSPPGYLLLGEIIPKESTRLSELVSGNIKEELEKIEETIYTNPNNNLINWDAETLIRICKDQGFTIIDYEIKEYIDTVKLSPSDIDHWFHPQQGTYGINNKSEINFTDLLKKEFYDKNIYWRRKVLFIKAKL